ncbi:MAG TPA: glycosyltransferase [Verrucomicrobiae bacterium]|nr:glycosyltransferase [Verrucomicrobiae bacterium]
MKDILLLVGNPDPIHIGAHFLHAAETLGLQTAVCDLTEAYEGALWRNRVNWWVRGRRPTRLEAFSAKVLEACRNHRPTWLLATGIAPIEEAALREIGKMDVLRLNYLTDDPWNPAHRAPWFLRAAPHYDYIFSPRRATLGDLRRLGCMSACYLPFAYASELHFPEQASDGERIRLASDIIFAGGADRDRVPYMEALIQAGFDVALYGGYWERYPQTAPAARGLADASTLRKAVSAARVSLCLVRRANRDGNVMRSFELPAMAGCLLAEDTEEHREIFGDDGEAVAFFRTREEMVEKLRWLLAHEDARQRLREAAHRVITGGHNTYRDRLEAILQQVAA